MSENFEKLQQKDGQKAEVSELSSEKLEKLKAKYESSVELSPRDVEARAEKAKIEALENAISVEAGGKEKASKPKGHTAIRRGRISKQAQETSYKQTMNQVQTELDPASRYFSKLTHNKTIEKASEVVGNTVARPNALLAGSFFSFILTLLAYTVAKIIGYKLSGFETIAAFIFGWIVGIIYDYFKILITGKNS